MTRIKFIEAVGAGLRKMGKAPDSLLVLVSKFDDWEWDEDIICGIPVIKAYVPTNIGHGGYDYPVIPCFKKESEDNILLLTVHFQKGFEDSLFFET